MSRYAFSLQAPHPTKSSWLRASPILIFILFIISIMVYLQLELGWDPAGTTMLVFFILFFIAIIASVHRSSRRYELTKQMLDIHLDKLVAKPGETVTGFLRLRIDRPRKFRSINARIWGGEHVEVVEIHGKRAHTYTEELPILDQELTLTPEGLAAVIPQNVKEPLRLTPGDYYYRFSIGIPPDALPSWISQLACVRYFTRFRINLPGCPELLGERDIWVVPEAQPATTERRPYDYRQDEHDVQTTIFRVELDNVETAPGKILSGRVIYSNPMGKTIRNVKLQFIELVWKTASGINRELQNVIAELLLQSQQKDTMVTMPFAINVPQKAFFTVRGRICSLRYLIRARANIAFAKDIEVAGEVYMVAQKN